MRMPCRRNVANTPIPSHDSGAATSLAELQDIFQRAITDADPELLTLIVGNSRTDRKVLLGVYQSAYTSRLIDVIRNDHPLLAAYLGDEAFEDMAYGYITRHPSRSPNARWVAHQVPDFLAAVSPYCDHTELAELAAIERALNDAFDAVDAPVMGLASLAQVDAEAWGDLVFQAHPSAQRLDNVTNACAIWLALNAADDPPLARKAHPVEHLIVWRGEVTPKLRVLPAEEAMMWNEAVKGGSFAALCELCAFYDDAENAPMRAARYLHAWLECGLLKSASLKGRRWSGPDTPEPITASSG